MRPLNTVFDCNFVQCQEHSIVSDPYCSVKSKLFAPTSSFLNSKYVPPEVCIKLSKYCEIIHPRNIDWCIKVINEEPRPLPGSKNAQFKDVKSKLGRLTQAAINQQYVQPGTSPAPESKIHTTTFSPDERREIWERLLKPTQSREAAKYVKPPPPPTEPKDFYVETVIRQVRFFWLFLTSAIIVLLIYVESTVVALGTSCISEWVSD